MFSVRFGDFDVFVECLGEIFKRYLEIWIWNFGGSLDWRCRFGCYEYSGGEVKLIVYLR